MWSVQVCVHNAFTNSIAPKSALKKTRKDADNKENVSPDLYEVKRRRRLYGELAITEEGKGHRSFLTFY